MAEGTIQLPADSTGKILRTQEVTVAGKLVEQENVTLANADGSLVTLPGALNADGGLVTHVQNFPAVQTRLATVSSAAARPLPTAAAVRASQLPADSRPIITAANPRPVAAAAAGRQVQLAAIPIGAP